MLQDERIDDLWIAVVQRRVLGGKLYAVARKVALLYRCWRRGEGEGSVHVFDAIGDGRGRGRRL